MQSHKWLFIEAALSCWRTNSDFNGKAEYINYRETLGKGASLATTVATYFQWGSSPAHHNYQSWLLSSASFNFTLSEWVQAACWNGSPEPCIVNGEGRTSFLHLPWSVILCLVYVHKSDTICLQNGLITTSSLLTRIAITNTQMKFLWQAGVQEGAV